MSNSRFMFLWILGSIFAFFVSIGAFVTIVVSLFMLVYYIWGIEIEAAPPIMMNLFVFISSSLMGIAMGLLYGGIQNGLLRQKTQETWSGWMAASMMGGIVGINFDALLIGFYGEFIWLQKLLLSDIVLFSIPFICVAITQMFVLQKHVRGAWTWTLANVVSGLVIYAVLIQEILDLGTGTTPLFRAALIGIVVATPGIVTGFSMLWLLNFNGKQDDMDY